MPWLLTGALLMAAYVAQATGGWRWEWLAAVQENELYKQLTGLVLVLFFMMQWRLSVTRMGSASPAVRLLTLHRDFGALAPLLLYLHAISFGHAYIRVMSIGFLALVALGLLQQPLARLTRNRMSTVWMVVHVTLATLLLFLISYHAFNAYYYE
jgi:cytochrome b561